MSASSVYGALEYEREREAHINDMVRRASRPIPHKEPKRGATKFALAGFALWAALMLVLRFV